MNELYFGKIDERYFFYLDPIAFNINEFVVKSKNIYCNELIFDSIKCEIINKKSYSKNDFIELLNRNNIISEFDLIIDENIHIQNIWWNDLLLISNMEIINLFIHYLKPKMTLFQLNLLENIFSNPNKLFLFSKDIIYETPMNPNEFITYIKNSERYLQKEFKIINSQEILY